jgi:tetratricopeptide (TPR) repeat protein
LWASWCSPCVKELRELATRAGEIREHGLQVIALSVDAVGTDHAGSPAAARKLLTEVGFPFEAGLADAAAVDMVELLHGAIVHTLRPFPIPTSLLIDPSGWVVAVYQGAVDVDVVLEDAGALVGVSDASRRDLAIPFAGRWSAPWEFFDYLNTMGLDFMGAGYPRHAESHYRKLLELDASNAQWLNNLGLALAAQGRFDEAEPLYREALEHDPDRAELLHNLGTAELELGRTKEAAAHLARALQLQPERPDTRGNLGAALAQTGQMRDALPLLRAALEQEPNLPTAATMLAWILATAPGSDARETADAVRLAEHAAQLTGQQHAPTMDALGAAYARVGRFDEAAAAAQRALALARATGQTQLAREIEERERLYHARRAFLIQERPTP